jgi:lysophospholipid acyltransferase (LPLAT)-like uncharacterized protein
MNPLRSIRSSAFGRWAISSLGAGYIVLAHATTRWTIVGEENRARIVGGEGRWIVGLWHGRIMALPPEKTSRFPCYAIVSANKDGEIIAATLRRFGIGALRGSSWDRKKNRDKGGREAFDAAAALLQENENMVIAFTPDGPRGPRQRCPHGIATRSVASGVPVIPLAWSTRRGRNLRSWDRMLLSWPFNRGVKIFGDPIVPPSDSSAGSIEKHRQAIEDALNALGRRADEMCGRAPIEPAEPLM